MSDHTVKIVATKDILYRIPERSDKYISFLRYWISLNDTKVVVTLLAWKDFERKWLEDLKDYSSEITDPFFATMRGLVTPYRTKYATEAGLNVDTEQESIKIDEITIVEWHYATVKYMITSNPEQIISSGRKLKIPNEFVLTPRELFGKLEVEDGEIIDRFLGEFNE